MPFPHRILIIDATFTDTTLDLLAYHLPRRSDLDHTVPSFIIAKNKTVGKIVFILTYILLLLVKLLLVRCLLFRWHLAYINWHSSLWINKLRHLLHLLCLHLLLVLSNLFRCHIIWIYLHHLSIRIHTMHVLLLHFLSLSWIHSILAVRLLLRIIRSSIWWHLFLSSILSWRFHLLFLTTVSWLFHSGTFFLSTFRLFIFITFH